jgi:2'-5' RNA ligase
MEQQAREVVTRTGGKPVPPNKYHATIAFLGSIAHERLPVLHTLASHVVASAFTLQLDHIHAWRRSGVLFMSGDRVPMALTQLVETLQSTLREHEFAVEERPFRLHVTLARDARLQERLPIEPIEWRIDDFVLAESTSGRSGAHYDIIGRWPLACG